MEPAEPDGKREVGVDVLGEGCAARVVRLVPISQGEQRIRELSGGERDVRPRQAEPPQLRQRSLRLHPGVGGPIGEDLGFDKVVPRRPPLRIAPFR